MGVNNRARRAAKRRKRATSTRSRPGGGGEPVATHAPTDPCAGPEDPLAGDLLIADCVGMIARGEDEAARLAQELLGGSDPVRPAVVARAMQRVLGRVAVHAGHAGWTPHDLSQLVRRRLTSAHQPLLAHLLHEETQRHRPERVAPQWRDEIAAMGRRAAARCDTAAGLALALDLSTVLGSVPVIPRLIPPPGQADPLAAAQRRAPAGGQDAKILARVRGLLAKAESTEFPDEAEAFSAKAQELISRHSLERLIARSDRPRAPEDPDIVSRRLWIDAPYVGAKASLVHQVAHANRCSSVVAATLGFTTVVGAAADLNAVEMLTTSLMVQADTAMLAAGRRRDRDGTSRTASFRRSFLLAYATRIGERLSAADEAAVAAAAESDMSGALVPLLRGQEERVESVMAQLFPHTVRRPVSVGNWQGWAEGMAAADRARLDDHPPIAG